MNDIDRDEHLRAALRHAPDAELAAPADISAQILAAAHRAAAARPVPAPVKRPWWKLDTPRRLGTSGAFASLLLAGFIGLLWRDQTPGPAPEPMVVATAPAPAPAATPAPAAVLEHAPPPATPPRIAADQALSSPQAVADSAMRQESERRRLSVTQREAPQGAALKEAMSAPPPAPAPPAPPPPAAPLAKPQQEADASQNSVARPAPAAAVVAAAPAPAPAVVAEPAARTDAFRGAVAGRAAVTPALMAVPRPTAPWMDAAAAGPAVQWKVDGEARAPTSSWLYALAAQTQGRWRDVHSPTPAAGDNEVQWWRGDMLLGHLWLGAERALWCDAQTRCQEAPLAVDVTTALRKGLAR